MKPVFLISSIRLVSMKSFARAPRARSSTPMAINLAIAFISTGSLPEERSLTAQAQPSLLPASQRATVPRTGLSHSSGLKSRSSLVCRSAFLRCRNVAHRMPRSPWGMRFRPYSVIGIRILLPITGFRRRLDRPKRPTVGDGLCSARAIQYRPHCTLIFYCSRNGGCGS